MGFKRSRVRIAAPRPSLGPLPGRPPCASLRRMTVTSRLFDADGTDDAVEIDASLVERLGDRQLLWVDVHGADEDELRRVAEILHFEGQSVRNLLNPIGRPRL